MGELLRETREGKLEEVVVAGEDEATRLKRKQTELNEAFEANARLLESVHDLEFSVLESHRRLVRYKRRMKRYLSRFSAGLERAGYTVQSLPQILFSEDLREDTISQQSLEEALEGDLKKRKLGRPKKTE